LPPEAAAPQKPKRTLKSTLFFLAKVALAGGLVAWLVLSGQLDFKALLVFYDVPFLLAFDLGLFFLGCCIGTFRFQTLLKIADVRVSFGKMFMLQMTAFFFNVVIPGNIGGDVVKALYVARDAGPEKRTTILLLAFVERILGLSSLILVGGVVCAVQPSVWSHPLLRPMATVVAGLAAVMIAGGVVALVLVRTLGSRLDLYTSGPSKLSKLLNQLVASLRIVSQGPRHMVVALLVSTLFHFGAIGLFTALTNEILHTGTTYSAVATVFPLGLLSLMLPISPAGLGVGHVAFQKLFEAIGIAGGATVFNVFVLGQNSPAIIGVIPFLMLKKRGELPPEAAA
jgi:uncharacterized protein (TIRG00374 family)